MTAQTWRAVKLRCYGWVFRTCARRKERRRETNRTTGRDTYWEGKKCLGNKAEFVYWSQNPFTQSCAETLKMSPTKGQREPTTLLFFINTRGYLFSVSLTQSSLRHRESVHLSSTQAQCSMCLCFPEENCPPFSWNGGLFLLDKLPIKIQLTFKAVVDTTVPRVYLFFHNTLNRE